MGDAAVKSDPAVRKMIEGAGAAILPVGSIEQHGAHLPVSTDSVIASEVARRLSERNGYLLLPVVTYGVSYEHAPLFHMSVREETLRSVVVDLCESLSASGIKTVFVLNGHYGNQDALKGVEAAVHERTKGGTRVRILSYWRFIDKKFDHAGPVETSLMLAVSKHVDMSLAKKGLDTDGMREEDVKSILEISRESFVDATRNGIWGDPRTADASTGRRILEQAVYNLSKSCQSYITKTA